MDHLVRRTEHSSAITEAATDLPARQHHFGAIVVISQLSVGVEPRLCFSWKVLTRAWNRGFKLLVFRSTTGFSPEPHPEDLNKHGQLFIETIHDGSHSEVPHEGTHFFSLVLHKKGLFGLWDTQSILRFSETVPSAKVAVARVKDQFDLHDMLQCHEVGNIEYAAKLNEAKIRSIRSRRTLQEIENPTPQKTQSATEALIAEGIENIDGVLEAKYAKRQKISEVKKDKRFRKMNPKERDEVLEEIEDSLDPQKSVPEQR